MIVGRVQADKLIAGLNRYASDLDSAAQRAIENGVSAAAKVARGTTKFKDRTGALRRSVVGQPSPSTHGARLIASAPHAKWVEEGTAFHIIRPRKKSVLSFVVAGRRVFARRVVHPGTKPTNFLSDAMSTVAPIVQRNIESAAENLARRI